MLAADTAITLVCGVGTMLCGAAFFVVCRRLPFALCCVCVPLVANKKQQNTVLVSAVRCMCMLHVHVHIRDAHTSCWYLCVCGVSLSVISSYMSALCSPRSHDSLV